MGIWLVLLLVLVVSLAGAGFYAVVKYRRMADDLAWRARILPKANKLNNQVADLRIILGEIKGANSSREHLQRKFGGLLFEIPLLPDIGEERLKSTFETALRTLRSTQSECLRLLDEDPELSLDSRPPIHEMGKMFDRIEVVINGENWTSREDSIEEIGTTLGNLQILSAQLPEQMHEQFGRFSEKVQRQYRWLSGILGTTGVVSGILLISLIRLSYAWVFQPLQTLIDGSRLIAAGHFGHRIAIKTNDEIAELADSMNRMTESFETIRNELDQEVRERTREAVRSERLASVGFLAAGVAHEINNPLASIAMCAESLQKRVRPLLKSADPQVETPVIDRYLQMIQDEAFRCKEITEKLLDFSRAEKTVRERTNLTALIFGMTEMITQHEKYKEKDVYLDIPESIFAMLNAQEMKQVALNLLTNALDAISPGGFVRISLRKSGERILWRIEDNGCGMDEEVIANIFEPFYTNRKYGQGNGLGLSITHRIIADHHGRITAESPGPGKGSIFTIELPTGKTK